MMSRRAFRQTRLNFRTSLYGEPSVRPAHVRHYSSAAAPAMISVSSVVIFACRARL